MAETAYKPISWQSLDLATTDKLQQMNANIDYLKDNTPRARLRGVGRDTGIRILAGIAVIPRQKDSAGSQGVKFGEFFSTGCNPIITTGIITQETRIHVTIRGLNSFIPNEDGFVVHAQMDNPDAKKNKLDSKLYVHWQAIGY